MSDWEVSQNIDPVFKQFPQNHSGKTFLKISGLNQLSAIVTEQKLQ
jgi:hypothetical protein